MTVSKEEKVDDKASDEEKNKKLQENYEKYREYMINPMEIYN